MGLYGVNLFPQQKLTKLIKLYLADNQMEAVPQVPETVRILHLQVWIFYCSYIHTQIDFRNCCHSLIAVQWSTFMI